MNAKDIRSEAAQTLGISTAATPAEVSDAYDRRAQQFVDFGQYNHSVFFHRMRELYDAHEIMSVPANKQWLAQIKVALTNKHTKDFQTLIAMVQVLRNMTDSAECLALLDKVKDLLTKIQQQNRTVNALYTYIMGMLIGKMGYDQITGEPDPTVGLVVYGSILVAALWMAFVMDSMDKTKTQISTHFDKMQNYRGK